MNYRLGVSALLAVSLLGACSTTEKTETTPKTTETASEDTNTTQLEGVTLKEPAKDEVCAFCNMKAFQKSEDLGGFTAQAVDENGKNLFFDDAGCMLNYEREHKVKLDKYVRDYDSKEWMKLDKAIVVEGDFKTPMKYGFAYFSDKESADAFVAKNTDSEITEVSEIDDKAHERYQAMSKKSDDSQHDSDEETDDGHGH